MTFYRTITLISLLFSFYILNAQQPTSYNLKLKSDPHAQFNDIIEYKNELWLITNSAICRVKNNQIVKVISKDNLSKFVIAENKLLVWSFYGEFFEINDTELKPLAFNKILGGKLENKIINSVEYNDSTFWISSVIGNGLIKIDLKSETIKNIPTSANYPYFVSPLQGGVISGNNSSATKKELIVNFKSSLKIPVAENFNFSKTNIVKLDDGSFVFTRQYEAIRFNDKKIITRVFVEKNIEDITQDRSGKIWLALNGGGLISYPNGNFNSNNSVKYLGNKTVICIIEDNYGNVWCGTSGDGIYKFPNSSLLKYDPPKVFSEMNKEETIESNLIVSSIPESNGSSTKIISTNAEINSLPPSVFINEIKFNGEISALSNYYELSSSQNNIEISISGIHEGSSELQYKYILEGADTNWNYSASTSFYYPSLNPGDYTYKVFAMSDKGVWSKTPVVITFNILPPFYQSLWFIIAIIFIFLAIIFLFRYGLYKRKQTQSKKIEEEKKKALISELHALRSQMNPHFIFNTLSSIQSFITKNNSEEALNYLSKFSKLMRSTLENTQQQKISIKEEIDMLRLYMDLEKLRLNNKFEYEINTSEDIDLEFDEIPPLLIQPFVENAIWHGVSHKENNGFIKVLFELIGENNLKCTIEDNGVGRKKAKEIFGQQKKNKSLGMSITKERLEIINSLKNSKLNVNIIDLKSDGTACGTKIELFIPLD